MATSLTADVILVPLAAIVASIVIVATLTAKRKRKTPPLLKSPPLEAFRRRSFRSQRVVDILHEDDESASIIERGNGSYLVDEQGRRYLDSRNNVAHVGHQHPKWIAAVCEQCAITNTNARYLHRARNELLERLTKSMNRIELEVCFLCNSGSEATELALRLIRAHSSGKRKKVIAVEMGYHGWTNAALEVSQYKFRNKELPENTLVLQFGADVTPLLKDNENNVAGMIVESALSVGGVRFPPTKHWLGDTFRAVQEAGGLCVCDEIQVGLGRCGKWFWTFQRDEGCHPDIVTIGKGLGNGFPVAAVVCTRRAADALDAENRELFSTFGGNPVACRAALAVLDILENEKLQSRAFETGEYLKSSLQNAFPTTDDVVDVRGEGLFVGIEFLKPDLATYVSHRLLIKHRILSSLDGPNDCVMVVKPPLSWQCAHVDEFVRALFECVASHHRD